MVQKSTVVHDSVMEEFTPTCRHCKKTADEHMDGTEDATGKCLFEATTWEEMSHDEWTEWRKSLWAELSADFIRDQLRSNGIASRIKTDLMVYGNAFVEATPASDGIKVTRVEPWLVDEKK
jgi:hypothetical protein